MFHTGRLIGDVLAFIGAVLMIAGLLLLMAQYSGLRPMFGIR